MNISMIFAVGIVVAVIAVIVGTVKAEYGVFVSLCGGVMMLLASLPGIEKLIETVTNAAQNAGIGDGYVGIVVKASGISCISTLCAAMCRDMGQTAVGAKIELAGRIAIVLTAVPAIEALLSLIERTV